MTDIFTAGHLERVRLANIAVGEVEVGLVGRANIVNGTPTVQWSRRGGDVSKRRARLLAVMEVSGPDTPVVCVAHDAASSPGLWAECAKVSVVSALLGRTCWKAQR